MPCRSTDIMAGIPLVLHFGDQPKLQKTEKPKWESLPCSASCNEFCGEEKESGYRLELYPNSKTEHEVVSIINLVNNC